MSTDITPEARAERDAVVVALRGRAWAARLHEAGILAVPDALAATRHEARLLTEMADFIEAGKHRGDGE